jgi:hypothetical protein
MFSFKQPIEQYRLCITSAFLPVELTCPVSVSSDWLVLRQTDEVVLDAETSSAIRSPARQHRRHIASGIVDNAGPVVVSGRSGGDLGWPTAGSSRRYRVLNGIRARAARTRKTGGPERSATPVRHDPRNVT